MQSADKLNEFLTNFISRQETGKFRNVYGLPIIASRLAGEPYSKKDSHTYLRLLAQYHVAKNWKFTGRGGWARMNLRIFDKGENHKLVVKASRIAYLHSARLERLLILITINDENGIDYFKGIRSVDAIAEKLSNGPYPPYSWGACRPYLLALTAYGKAKAEGEDSKRWKSNNAKVAALKNFEDQSAENKELVGKAANIMYLHSKDLKRWLNLLISAEEGGLIRGAHGLRKVAERLDGLPYPSFGVRTSEQYLDVLAEYGKDKNWDFEYKSKVNTGFKATLQELAESSKQNQTLLDRAAEIAKQYKVWSWKK